MYKNNISLLFSMYASAIPSKNTSGFNCTFVFEINRICDEYFWMLSNMSTTYDKSLLCFYNTKTYWHTFIYFGWFAWCYIISWSFVLTSWLATLLSFWTCLQKDCLLFCGLLCDWCTATLHSFHISLFCTAVQFSPVLWLQVCTYINPLWSSILCRHCQKTTLLLLVNDCARPSKALGSTLGFFGRTISYVSVPSPILALTIYWLALQQSLGCRSAWYTSHEFSTFQELERDVLAISPLTGRQKNFFIYGHN